MSVVAEDFVQFVNSSPSPYHAVVSSQHWLDSEGFVRLRESEDWRGKLVQGGKYYFSRNHSTLVAFAVGEQFKVGNGFNIIAAHTDSPCLKVKPVSKIEREGYLQLAVSTYGGGIWHTWFDRDLAIAGRVVVRNKNGGFENRLVYLNKAVCNIPSLAIHLDRTQNESFQFNSENHLVPILATVTKGVLEGANEKSQHHPILLKAIAQELNCAPSDICDFDLNLLDHQPACKGGLQNEFLYSGRLDNLMSCWVSLQSFLKSLSTLDREQRVRMVAFFDMEEVGSQGQQGADSDLMPSVFARVNEALLGRDIALNVSKEAANNVALSANVAAMSQRNSFLISADMAHALHPNYPEKHEARHRPRMHQGTAIKINKNGRYATTVETHFFLEELARERNIPVQVFAVRNDSPCGTTIGPILSSLAGIRTVDCGIPQLAMHSCRETCATTDVDHALNLFEAFFNMFTELDKRLNSAE